MNEWEDYKNMNEKVSKTWMNERTPKHEWIWGLIKRWLNKRTHKNMNEYEDSKIWMNKKTNKNMNEYEGLSKSS